MSDIRTDDLKTGNFDTWAELERRRGEAIKTVVVKVDNKAATRQAVIVALRKQGLTFQTRAEWKAKPPKADLGADWDYEAVVIHHAGNSYSCAADGAAQLRKAQANEMSGPFDDVSYHYAVDCGGVIYEARDIRFKGAHVDGGNSKKVGVVLLADLSVRGEAWDQEYKKKSLWERIKGGPDIVSDAGDVARDDPTEPQLKALSQLVEVLRKFFPITTLGGHREFQKKATGHVRACPGITGMLVVEQLRKETGLVAP